MQHSATDSDAPKLPRINKISPGDPVNWLKAGWEDFKNTGYRGAFYGGLFFLMGYAIVRVYATRWQLTMGLISGFFLMGPFICTGLYELSRQLHRGESVSLSDSMVCWRRNLGAIAFFAVILTFAMIVWARVSVILFALFSTTSFPTLKGVLLSIFSLDNAAFVFAWLGVGFLFASIVYAIGVVAVPMMLDRKDDTLTAVFTSVRTILNNPVPMYLWAALVVIIIGASLLLGFFPLVVTAPVVGHATWHAYRQLVAG